MRRRVDGAGGASTPVAQGKFLSEPRSGCYPARQAEGSELESQSVRDCPPCVVSAVALFLLSLLLDDAVRLVLPSRPQELHELVRAQHYGGSHKELGPLQEGAQ